MQVSDFNYEYPEALVATESAQPPSSARLLVYDRKQERREHTRFSEILSWLSPRDLIVVNNTCVLPARFKAKKNSGAQWEGLFLEPTEGGVRVWIQGKAREGDWIEFPHLRCLQVLQRREREAFLDCPAEEFINYLKNYGEAALPPYIRKSRKIRGEDEEQEKDEENYQTLFAREAERYSVAAPTASLHFDRDLLAALAQKSIPLASVTLHVGEGTFAPMEISEVEKHQMHSEWIEVSGETWAKIKRTKKEGGRVVAVGTTVVRTLESLARQEAPRLGRLFQTDLFIHPPYSFRIVDALVTNFHLPKTSLLLLIASFLEPEFQGHPGAFQHRWKNLYQEGIEKNYRLFSFGDAMLIL